MATSLKPSKAVGTARAGKKSAAERAAPLDVRSRKPKKPTSSKSQPAPATLAVPRPTSKPAKSQQASSSPTAARQTKSDLVLNLLRKPGGVSLGELCTATGWQAHSVRGFLSGALRKKQGVAIESFKTGEGERRYRLAAQPK